MNEAYLSKFMGERAVILATDSLEAVLLPEIGSNLIAFRDKAKGYNYIREPESAEEMEEFKLSPVRHGVPILYPPNRYRDGKITVNGKDYQFPVNEKDKGNHLHGFLYGIPWNLTEYGANQKESYAAAEIRIDEQHEVFKYFPHAFVMKIRYILTDKELKQEISVTNEGGEPMPHMLGYHTALKAPFAPGSTAEDCLLQLTVGERLELDERMLPTGGTQRLSELEERMKRDGMPPYNEMMDNHYTASPRDGKNQAVITDRKAGCRLVYEAGPDYKFWMVWNGFASGSFLCPEPQTSMVNAPNTGLSEEETGLRLIAPGETWTASSRWYGEPV